MIRFILRIACIVATTVALGACKKEDPNPELSDPIFKDLEARAAAYTRNVDESKAKIPPLEEQISKAEPRSIDLKNLQKELSKEKIKLLNSEQLARYYKIRAERRRLTGRLAYKKAFAADKPWPDPREYSDYLVNIRLQEANRNWAARVPKLQDRMPGSVKGKGKTEKAEAPKEH